MLIRRYIFGLVFLVSSSFALSNTEFTYDVIDGGIEVTGCADSCPSNLVIPEEIDGFTVQSVGEYAFSYKNLSSLVLPDSIIRVENGAFSNNSLSYLLLPENLIFLGAYSFAFNNISSLSISNSVEVIGQSALQSNELTHVIIPSNVSYIGFWSFGINPLTSIIFYGSRPDISGDAFVDKPEFGDFISLTSIAYCDENNGWPGEPIEGITPQLDEDCGDTNDHGDEEHEEEHHGDGEYCYGDEHGDEDGHEDGHDHDGHCYSVLDLDQNGSFDALTDGLIVLRYAFGLRGDDLINTAIASDATRTSASEIEAHIQSLLP
jgi:hypothetical protein